MKKLITVQNYRLLMYAIAFLTIIGFALVSEVMIDTGPIISTAQVPDNLGPAIGGGIAAVGCLGAGIGQGIAAGRAAEAVGRNPEAEAKIRNTMIIGASIAETGALYAFVASIIIVFIG